MSETPTAFPWTHKDITCTGMTLRDYFAAKAMNAFILAASTNENMTALLIERAKTNNFKIASEDWIAYSAYAQADAMMKVRTE